MVVVSVVLLSTGGHQRVVFTTACVAISQACSLELAQNGGQSVSVLVRWGRVR